MEPKKIVAPLQGWLLSQGRCVGCGRLLVKKKKEKKDGVFIVSCDCRRIFIFNPGNDSYRRALFEEIE